MLQKNFHSVSHHALLKEITEWEYTNPYIIIISITFSVGEATVIYTEFNPQN